MRMILLQLSLSLNYDGSSCSRPCSQQRFRQSCIPSTSSADREPPLYSQNFPLSKRLVVETSQSHNVPSQNVPPWSKRPESNRPHIKAPLHNTSSCSPTGCHTGCTSYNRLHQLCRVKNKNCDFPDIKKLLKLRISICVYDYSAVGDRMKPFINIGTFWLGDVLTTERFDCGTFWQWDVSIGYHCKVLPLTPFSVCDFRPKEASAKCWMCWN